MMDNKEELIKWVYAELAELSLKCEDDPDLEYFERAIDVYIYALEKFKGDGYQEAIILKRLLDGDPLCSLDGGEKWWRPWNGMEDTFYHIRRPSLLKQVCKDEKEVYTLYTDSKRVECIDQNDPHHPYENGCMEYVLVNQIDPIKFPYKPVGKFKVYTGRYLYDEANKDKGYDTLIVTYIRRPDYRIMKVYKYYKFMGDNWLEIDEHEFVERAAHAR